MLGLLEVVALHRGATGVDEDAALVKEVARGARELERLLEVLDRVWHIANSKEQRAHIRNDANQAAVILDTLCAIERLLEVL